MQTQKTRNSEAQGVWRFDPAYTTVEFSVKKMFLFTVKGSFTEIEGSIVRDDSDITQSSVLCTIKAHSLRTGNASRDDSLRAASFLDVAAHPLIEFKSTSVKPGQDRDTLDVKGMVTLKGKDREVRLLVNEVDRSRAPSGEEYVYYSATAELDRYAFGITHMPGVIGRLLKVTINVQASGRGL